MTTMRWFWVVAVGAWLCGAAQDLAVGSSRAKAAVEIEADRSPPGALGNPDTGSTANDPMASIRILS